MFVYIWRTRDRILLKNRTKGLAGKKLGLRVGEKAEHAKLVSFVIKKIINVLCATTGEKPMLKNTHAYIYNTHHNKRSWTRWYVVRDNATVCQNQLFAKL